MKVVSNSGPLINLAKVGQFSLLEEIFQRILIPMAVFQEVAVRGAGQPGATETRTARWIARRRLKQPDIANILTAELDRGEAEAIGRVWNTIMAKFTGKPVAAKGGVASWAGGVAVGGDVHGGINLDGSEKRG